MSIYIDDAEFLPTGCIEQTLDPGPPGTDCCGRYPARAIAGPAFTTFLNPAVHDPRPSCCWVDALASAPPGPNCPLIVVDLLGPRAHHISLLAGGYDDYNGRTLVTYPPNPVNPSQSPGIETELGHSPPYSCTPSLGIQPTYPLRWIDRTVSAGQLARTLSQDTNTTVIQDDAGPDGQNPWLTSESLLS